MVFASYGRKSVYSDTSDSVKNQHRMNKDYVEFHFNGEVDSFLIYEDEDSTGANMNRPDLKRLIKDVESGVINFLIVYQLDRLSRDVRDFSNVYAFLEEHNVQFISVKENIDTSTPIGKAMMYVAVIFAQMERETIANRVFDNMIGLSDSGWWVGGNPPIGYKRQRISTEDGKNHVTIVQVPEEVEEVKNIYNIFLENKFSLQQMESYFKRNNILTKNGNFFSTNQLHKILTMPYCVEATPVIYDFYKSKGCIMSKNSPRELWNGSVGVMIYGRTTERNKKHALNPVEKWRVCLGKQKPFIDSEMWLKVQQQFTHNVFEKTMKHDITLLKGILRCSCGRLMSLSRKHKVDGGMSTWYYCPKRMRQGSEYCDMKQVKSNLLDDHVIEIFKAIQKDPDEINKFVHISKSTNPKTECKKVESKLLSEKHKVENLTAALTENANSSAAKYIITEIEKHDSTIKLLTRTLASLQAKERSFSIEKNNLEMKRKKIVEFMNNFDTLTYDEKNSIAKSCIVECTWDGTQLSITL